MLLEMKASSLYKCNMKASSLSIASILWLMSLDIPQKHKLSVDTSIVTAYYKQWREYYWHTLYMSPMWHLQRERERERGKSYIFSPTAQGHVMILYIQIRREAKNPCNDFIYSVVRHVLVWKDEITNFPMVNASKVAAIIIFF